MNYNIERNLQFSIFFLQGNTKQNKIKNGNLPNMTISGGGLSFSSATSSIFSNRTLMSLL